MEFLELKNISERFMELANPTSAEKILGLGELSGLELGKRVIDFGCGFGEALALWAERFGISGVGIDIREYACDRARQKMAMRGISDRVEIVCASGSEYRIKQHSFDLAVCIGASFIWGGFQPSLRAMKLAIHEQGKLAVGEPYWISDQVPADYRLREKDVLAEHELLDQARQEGFDVEWMVRASREDWDRYESSNWHGLIRWIEENPDHPERQQVIDHLHESQEEYFRYARKYFGWCIYVLNPIGY